MTRIAQVDCLGGASGNMLLGAVLDAGLPEPAFRERLRELPLSFDLDVTRVRRHGIAALHVDVRTEPEHSHRHLPQIAEIIDHSTLPADVKRRALAVFERLAEAEGRVHGIDPREVHFHEVGAVDAIVDIVGVCLGLSMLGVDALYFGALPVGTGPIHCAHGVMPNPAPATAELLRGVPLRFLDVAGELVTPTGAALLVTLGHVATPPTASSIRHIGHGAGTRDPEALPNLTRLLVLETSPGSSTPSEVVTQIETNIDDMNPQLFDYVMERLFSAGALDVYLTPIQMKKNRPAVMLTVLGESGMEQRLIDIVLAECSTLGVRLETRRRVVLPRRVETVDTSMGTVRVKFVGVGAKRWTVEYDDCRRLASSTGRPLWEVMELVRREVTQAAGDV